MNFIVSIAICLLATPVQLCGKDTSIAWLVAPERPPGLEGCMRHGMLYAAESHLVQPGSFVKVFCAVKR